MACLPVNMQKVFITHNVLLLCGCVVVHCPLEDQLATVRQELAVKSTELSHVSTSLQEHKDSLVHTRTQLASVQDNLSGQMRSLQRELSAVQAEKLQTDREVGRLKQEGMSVTMLGVDWLGGPQLPVA